MSLDGVKALVFDVFGTVVDWRSGVARDAAPFLARHAPPGILAQNAPHRGPAQDTPHGGPAQDTPHGGPAQDTPHGGPAQDTPHGGDAGAFADAWRRRYMPAMEEVRSGRRPFTRLDVLHRENLEAILPEFGIDPARVPDAELDALNLAWHRLDPWPDAVEGLTRLRKKFIIAPLSNGNIILMIDMAKRAGLPWDAILGAELAQAYKPMPEAYLRTAETLAMAPAEVCLVAAHHGDLAAARRCGLRTCYVPRPFEHGPDGVAETAGAQDWDLVATDFSALAGMLGA